jgi:5-methylcytosine-specific restriction endonuclease McrA
MIPVGHPRKCGHIKLAGEAFCKTCDSHRRRTIYSKTDTFREQSRAKCARHYRKHKSRYQIKRKAEYATNRDKERARNQAWIRSHPDEWRAICARRRAARLGAFGSHSLQEWQAVIATQNGCCARCGVKAKLQRDHIIPLARGGNNFIHNIQGLCISCNSAKRHTIAVGTQFSLFDRTEMAA